MKIKYLFSAIQMLNSPGMVSSFRDCKTFIKIHFLYSAIETGLLDVLQTPHSRDALIEKLDVERPDVLDAILNVGLSVKELAYKNGMYSIRGKRSRSIIGRKGDTLAALIQGLVTYYNNAYQNAADILHGAPLGDDLFKIGGIIGRIGKLNEPIIKKYISEIISGREEVRILEIGCGSGIFLKSAFEVNPNTTGIGIDIDEDVVNQAKENMKIWGISDKFKIKHGDINNPSEEVNGTYDLITLFNIMYYFPVAKRAGLFKKLKSYLSTDGVVAIVNSIKNRSNDFFTANLNLFNTTAKGITILPSLDETVDQLKEGGFKNIKTTKFIPGSELYGIVAENSDS